MKYKKGQIVKFVWYGRRMGKPRVMTGKIVEINPKETPNVQIETKNHLWGVMDDNVVEICTIATLKEIRKSGKKRSNSKNTRSI
jgi:hypothetical protein